jgi:hypothetical protein
MIQVIKPCVLPVRRQYEGTCPYCKAELKCNAEDIYEAPDRKLFCFCPTPDCQSNTNSNDKTKVTVTLCPNNLEK